MTLANKIVPDTLPAPLPPNCRLVVFDLDGTLYQQGGLRRQMALRLLVGCFTARGTSHIRVVSRYRKLREALAEQGRPDFEDEIFDRLAAETGRGRAELRAVVAHWIEERPLPLLTRFAVPGAAALFAALRGRGIATAVWSDYPAAPKLAALSLMADHVVWAGDPEVGALKPDPAGLTLLLRRTGCEPHQALMVGDRLDRDGAAAARLGVPFLLRTPKRHDGTSCIADFRALAAALV